MAVQFKKVYWAMCQNKQPHKSEGAAMAHLRALLRKAEWDETDQDQAADVSTLSVYFCPFCRHYHVGHKS